MAGSDGADRDPLQDPGAEPPAQVGIEHVDADRVDVLPPHLLDLGLGQAERQLQPGGQVAGHARHRHCIGAVGVDLEVVEDVALDAHRVGEGHTRFRDARRQNEDPGVVAAQADLVGRAQHAVGPLAPHLAATDLEAVGHDRADGGQRNQVAGSHVEGTARDLQRLAVTGIDVDELDLVGVGVRARRQHPSDDDAIESLAQPIELLDGHAEVAEVLADLDGIALDRREVLEPGEKDLHRCPRRVTPPRQSKLSQEADVVGEEVTQVVDPVPRSPQGGRCRTRRRSPATRPGRAHSCAARWGGPCRSHPARATCRRGAGCRTRPTAR